MRPARELADRFGLPESLVRSLAFVEEQETIFAGTPAAMAFADVRPMRRGIRLCRLFPHSVKPTTFAMQLVGRHATRNVIDVGDEQVKALINGGVIDVESDASAGFVLIRWRGFVAGVGLYRRPRLKSQIPRFRPVE